MLECAGYRSRHFTVDHQTGILSERNLYPPFNYSRILVVYSISEPNQVAIVSTFSNHCPSKAKVDQSIKDVSYSIQFWSSEQFIHSQYSTSNAVSQKFYLLNKLFLSGNQIVFAKMFHANNARYVLIQYRLLHDKLTKLKIFKFTNEEQLFEITEQSHLSQFNIKNIDLIQIKSELGISILLSTSVQQSNVKSDTSLWIWNSKLERFDLLINIKLVGQPYLTKFIQNQRGLFLLFAVSNEVDCNSHIQFNVHKNVVHVYKLETLKRIEFYQRFLANGKLSQMESANVGTMAYLIVSIDDSLYIYQMEGYNKFQLMSQMNLNFQIIGFNLYWTSHNRLYLAIKSSHKSLLLSVVLSGSGKNSRFNSINNFQSNSFILH